MNKGGVFLVCGLVFLVFGLFGYVLAGGSALFVTVHFTLAAMSILLGVMFSGVKNLVENSRGSSLSLRVTGVQLLLLAVFATLLVVGNMFAARSSWSFDVTEARIYSLADETLTTLRQLEQPVTLYVLSVPKPQELYRRQELLERFRAANPEFIAIEILDPVRSPQQSAALGITANDALVIRYGDDPPMTFPEVQEEIITAALRKKMTGTERVVYFLAGHGEPSLTHVGPEGISKVKELLAREQLAAEPLLLAEHTAVPDDAAAVAVIAPLEVLPENEVAALHSFVAKGGDLFLLSEPQANGILTPLAAHYGMILSPSVVLDRTEQLFGAPEVGWQITTRAYHDHLITHGLQDTDLAVFLLGSPVIADPAQQRRNSLRPIVSSAHSAWGETNLTDLFAATPIAGFDKTTDLAGPVSLGMTAELHQQNGATSRIVVFGDSSWIRNQNVSVYANDELFTRSLLWAAEERRAVVARPRSFRKSVLLLSASAFRRLLLASFLIPELIFLLGIAVWWRRTRQVVAVA